MIATRKDGVRVSRNANAVTNKLAPAAANIAQNSKRHPPTNNNPLPASGASIGETEITSMTIAISFVPSTPV